MNQLQTIQQENRTLDKARLIASAKRVRRCVTNRNIWLVGSGNPKTPKKFYCVTWDEELDSFICDCPHFSHRVETCKHILACAIYEGNSSEKV